MKMPMLALLAGLALALSGCASPVSTSDADSAATSAPSAVSEPPAETPAESPAEEASGEEEVTDGEPLAFGKTVTFEDGLEMTITAPKKFTPSEYAYSGDAEGTPVIFQVTLKNGTSKTFDPALFYATVGSGEAEAEQIFDSGKGLEGSPTTKLLKDKTVKFKIGFMVLNAKDITMEANPSSFEYTNVIYTNNP